MKLAEIASAVSGIPHCVGVPLVVPVIWKVRAAPAVRAGGPNPPEKPWPLRVSMMRHGVIATNASPLVRSAAVAIEQAPTRDDADHTFDHEEPADHAEDAVGEKPAVVVGRPTRKPVGHRA